MQNASFPPTAPCFRLQSVFSLFIAQMDGLDQPHSPTYSRHYHLLEQLASVRAFTILPTLPESDATELTRSLFERSFHIMGCVLPPDRPTARLHARTHARTCAHARMHAHTNTQHRTMWWRSAFRSVVTHSECGCERSPQRLSRVLRCTKVRHNIRSIAAQRSNPADSFPEVTASEHALPQHSL
jgi:hypothetical protein